MPQYKKCLDSRKAKSEDNGFRCVAWSQLQFIEKKSNENIQKGISKDYLSRPLFINVTQNPASRIQHITDSDFRKQPVRRHGRIRLFIQISIDPLTVI